MTAPPTLRELVLGAALQRAQDLGAHLDRRDRRARRTAKRTTFASPSFGAHELVRAEPPRLGIVGAAAHEALHADDRLARVLGGAERSASRPTTTSPRVAVVHDARARAPRSSQSAIATGRSFSHVRDERVRRAEIDADRRAAAPWGRRSRGALIYAAQLVFDGAHLVEEAPVEAQLAEQRHELRRASARRRAAKPRGELASTPRARASHRRADARATVARSLRAPALRRAPRAARSSPSGTRASAFGSLSSPTGDAARARSSASARRIGIAHDAPRLVHVDRLLERGPPLARARAARSLSG